MLLGPNEASSCDDVMQFQTGAPGDTDRHTYSHAVRNYTAASRDVLYGTLDWLPLNALCTDEDVDFVEWPGIAHGFTKHSELVHEMIVGIGK